MRILAAALSLAFLTGCAEFAATVVTDARDLHSASREYVIENVTLRREIRRLCWEITKAEVQRLESEGQSEDALALLRANYPQLVTIRTVRQAIKDPEQLSAEPIGCNWREPDTEDETELE